MIWLSRFAKLRVVYSIKRYGFERYTFVRSFAVFLSYFHVSDDYFYTKCDMFISNSFWFHCKSAMRISITVHYLPCIVKCSIVFIGNTFWKKTFGIDRSTFFLDMIFLGVKLGNFFLCRIWLNIVYYNYSRSNFDSYYSKTQINVRVYF